MANSFTHSILSQYDDIIINNYNLYCNKSNLVFIDDDDDDDDDDENFRTNNEVFCFVLKNFPMR